jgi:hypothetical protein
VVTQARFSSRSVLHAIAANARDAVYRDIAENIETVAANDD